MDNSELDKLRFDYKAAVERWIAAIRTEENLATPDHSMVTVENWEKADFTEEDARTVAKSARKEYQDALRQVLFNF
jgi:GTP cyclohydrolase FolE2